VSVDSVAGPTGVGPVGYTERPGEPAKPGATRLGPGSFGPPSGGDAEALGLERPALMSSDQLAILLTTVKSKSDQQTINTATQDVERIKSEKLTAARKRIADIEKQAEQAHKAAKGGKLGKIFGWIAAAAMIVAGSALLLAGGSGTALLVAGIALAGVMALQETGATDKIVDGIAKGLQNSPFNLSPEAAQIASTVIVGTIIAGAAVAASVAGGPAVGATLFLQLEPAFLTPDNLEKMGVAKDAAPWVSLGIGIGAGLLAAGVGVGSAVRGLTQGAADVAADASGAAARGAAEGGADAAGQGGAAASRQAALAEGLARLLNTSPENITRIMRQVSYVTMGIQATATVAQGADTVATGVLQKSADDLDADAKKQLAMLIQLQQETEREDERIKKAVQMLQEAATTLTAVMRTVDETRVKILRTI
jgi:hypothetical protein